MDESQSLKIEQKTGIRLSQQQLRFVKLLELNASELNEAVNQELEDNPALEVAADDGGPSDDMLTVDGDTFRESADDMRMADYASPEEDPHYKYDTEYHSRSTDEIIMSATPDRGETLYEHLEWQLDILSLDPEIRRVAIFIIRSLDNSGYLRRSIPQLIDDMAFGPGIESTPEMVEEALGIVQSLEPYGVGATSLRECMLLQLRHKPKERIRDIAEEIVERYYDSFVNRHWDKVKNGLKGVTDEEFEKAMKLIRGLNPKPGAEYGSGADDAAMVIVPDFSVVNDDGHLIISLSNRVPELRIEQGFEEAMSSLRSAAKGRIAKGGEFLANRYNEARDFIKVIGQRQETLMMVMTAIVDIQKDYFLTHDVYKLRPMKIKDISAMTGLDISVISRATANKYVQAPWGVFPLRYFFSEGIGEKEDETDVITNRKIEAEIEAIVKAEDKRHPLSDQGIMEEMARRGFDVSRRTVAKYRDRKGIPVARLRKGWK